MNFLFICGQNKNTNFMLIELVSENKKLQSVFFEFYKIIIITLAKLFKDYGEVKRAKLISVKSSNLF